MGATHPALKPHPRLTLGEFFRVLRRFWPFVARYRGKFALGLLLVLVAVPLGQFSVFLTRDVTNRILAASEESVEARWGAVLAIVGLQAAFWLVSSLLATAREVIEWYLSMRSTYDLRMAFYRHLYRLPLSFLQQRPPGEHLYRATEDIGPRDGDGYAPGLMGMICRQAPQLLEAVYGVVWGAFLLSLVDPNLAWMLAAYIVPFALCANWMYDKMRQSAFAARGMAAYEQAVLRDSIAGLRTLKSIGRTLLQRRIYARAASDTKRCQNQLNFQTVLTTQGLIIGFRLAFSAIVFVYISNRVMAGTATIGDWVVTFLLVNEAQTPLEKAVQVIQQIRILIVPAQRVLETLDVEPTLHDPPNAVALGPLEGRVRYENVSFEYLPGVPVLRNVTFEIAPGEHVGFVGPSGAGKSSLLGLFLRLYAPSHGSVTIDGVDVSDVRLDSLLSQCAVVPQTAFLYEGTIRDNVLYGDPDASDAAFAQACRDAGVADFVERLADGYDTWIGEGTLLSGGEKQRVCIARALIRNPRVLILDEATSSLDSRTESEILECLNRIAQGRTVISIAHRLRAVMRCDRIHVLSQGRIVQVGSHADLVERDGLFREMWQEQTAEALLAGVGDDA
ncbi:MAG: ABC transporter ATP-binding protein [Fimbriimonadaceae bacterium]|nr:ABC transporter ATP-binding protein [Fimbriimonadaceae bacterium]